MRDVFTSTWKKICSGRCGSAVNSSVVVCAFRRTRPVSRTSSPYFIFHRGRGRLWPRTQGRGRVVHLVPQCCRLLLMGSRPAGLRLLQMQPPQSKMQPPAVADAVLFIVSQVTHIETGGDGVAILPHMRPRLPPVGVDHCPLKFEDQRPGSAPGCYKSKMQPPQSHSISTPSLPLIPL